MFNFCFIVPWKENIEMEMVNITLATFSLFFTLQLFPEVALPWCYVVMLLLD